MAFRSVGYAIGSSSTSMLWTNIERPSTYFAPHATDLSEHLLRINSIWQIHQPTNLTQILKQSPIRLSQMSVRLRPTAIAATAALSVILPSIIIYLTVQPTTGALSVHVISPVNKLWLSTMPRPPTRERVTNAPFAITCLRLLRLLRCTSSQVVTVSIAIKSQLPLTSSVLSPRFRSPAALRVSRSNLSWLIGLQTRIRSMGIAMSAISAIAPSRPLIGLINTSIRLLMMSLSFTALTVAQNFSLSQDWFNTLRASLAVSPDSNMLRSTLSL